MNPPEEQYKFQVDRDSQAKPVSPKQVRQPSTRSKGTPLVLALVVALGLVTLAGFLYLNHRLASTQSSGTMKVTTLSQNLEERFSSLSVKQARLEATLESGQKELTAQISETMQAIKTLGQEIDQQHEKTQQTLDSKVDPAELEKALVGVKKKLGAMDADLTDATVRMTQDRKELQTLSSALTGQLNEFEGILNETAKSVITLKTDLTDVAGRQLDKKAMGQEIKRQLGQVNKRISQFNAATEVLTSRLQSLQNSITSLKQNSGVYEREILKLRGQMNDLQRQLNTRPIPMEKLP